jgi:nitrilase
MSFLAAAVQASPVFLEREPTIDKACALIANAARAGAKLIVLPEAFVPGYPAWVWYLPLTRRADIAMLYRALVDNSVSVPGPEVERLGQAAREARAWVAIGVNERNVMKSGTTLYNTLLVFDDTGRLVERRRKLMPTGGERMVWAAGEPVVPQVHDTPFGRMSGLICWENYMPLARQAVYLGGTQIYLAPTWDKSDMWLASMRHIAREGRVFVIGCCQAIHRDQIPDRWPFKDVLPENLDWVNVGNSVMVDPEGTVIAGPLAEKEGLVTAEIDPGRATGSRWIFDAAGHYDRPDLFELRILVGDEADGGAGAGRPKRSRRAGRSGAGVGRTKPKARAPRSGAGASTKRRGATKQRAGGGGTRSVRGASPVRRGTGRRVKAARGRRSRKS